MQELSKTVEERRADMYKLEEQVLALPQLDLKPVHYFAKGMYARELFMPAGSVITGKIHKQEHLVIISSGTVSISTENGTQLIQGPATFVAPGGSKRAFFAHTDTLFTVIHSTQAKTVEAAEAELVTNNYEEVL